MQNHGFTPKGGLYVPSKPAIITGAAAAALAPAIARAHTNMGERR